MSGVVEFFAMGGHGGYVWSAWILAALALAVNAASAVREKRRALDEARRAAMEEGEGENL